MPVFEGVTAFACWIRDVVSTLGSFPVYSAVIRRLPLLEEAVGELLVYDEQYSTADDGRGPAPPTLVGKRVYGQITTRATYDGLDGLLAALMGHEAGMIGSTVMPESLGSGVYRHVYELSPLYQDTWRMGDGLRMGQAVVMGSKKPQRGTYAVNKSVAVWEFAGVSPSRWEFSAPRADVATMLWDMVGSAHREPATTNTVTVMNNALPPLRLSLLPEQCVWSIGPYSTTTALSGNHVVLGLPLIFTIDRGLSHGYGPETGLNPAELQQDASPPRCTAAFTVPSYSNDTLYGYYRAGTALMAHAKWTGPAIPNGGGATYAFRVYFPSCRIVDMSYGTTIGRNELRCVLALHTSAGVPAGFPATNYRGQMVIETIGTLSANQMF